MYFILTYQTVNRFNDRKRRYRAEHLTLVKSYHAEGKLIMAGALLEPNDAALFIFRCESAEEVEVFVQLDSYVQKNLVMSYDIRPWSVAIGGEEI